MTSKSCHITVIAMLTICLCQVISGSLEGSSHEAAETNKKNIEIYRRLLQQKRRDQLSAVEQIMAIEAYEKQYSMIKLLLQKMTSVLSQNVVQLRMSGFTPGDDFPTEENVKEALSLVVENTVFFGDILLRLPTITHSLLESNKEWDLLLKSSVGFVNETGILQERDFQLINLMAQELQIVERDPNYINPYKPGYKNEMDAQLKKAMNEEIAKEKNSNKMDTKKKKLKKGPRLSGRRIEL